MDVFRVFGFVSLAGLLVAVGLAFATHEGLLAGTVRASRAPDVLALGVALTALPYGAATLVRMVRTRRQEERLPDFLRELAASRRAGLTLVAAANAAARTDYGALNPLVRRLAEQLAWNMPFQDAFRLLTDDIGTPTAARVAAVMGQAAASGGNVSDVLLIIANDARDDLARRRERSTAMGAYLAIIYVGFGVFLFVALSLYMTLVPALASSSASVAAISAGASAPPALADYRTFYFVAALAQAIGNGFLVGVLVNGNARAGFLHVGLMAATVLLAFAGAP